LLKEGSDHPLLQLFGQQVLSDFSVPPVSSEADVALVVECLEQAFSSLHHHTTTSKTTRWMNWYAHAKGLMQKWHSLSHA
jgi:hypothetical protein